MDVFVISTAVLAHTIAGALVTDAYDGDTLTVEAALWPDLVWTGNVRVLGVDTLEIRGECEQENRWALGSRNYGRAYDGGTRGDWCDASLVLPSSVDLSTEETNDTEEELPADHPLVPYDDNGNGRISCAEARNHGIAPVYSTHPAYPYMTDADGDGVVRE